MAGTTIQQRIRIQINPVSWNNPTGIIDLITNAAPAIASGSDLQFELCISDGKTNAYDFTNVASVYIEITQNTSPYNSNAVVTASIPVGSITTGTTPAQFASGTDQIVLQVVSANTQLALGSATTNYRLGVYIVSVDTTPKIQPVLITNITAVDAGLPVGTPSLPQTFKAGSKLSFVCSDGKTRDLSIQKLTNGSWTSNVLQAGYNGPGQSAYSLYCSDGQYRDLTITLSGATWVLTVGQSGHS